MYTGTITNEDRVVRRFGEASTLNPRYDLVNRSPTGFCWGYNGSGPAQLALAILCDYLKNDKEALLLYQDFKSLVIARLPMDEHFILTDRKINDALTQIRARRKS
jgi:Family of unknown function (DUF6166)